MLVEDQVQPIGSSATPLPDQVDILSGLQDELAEKVLVNAGGHASLVAASQVCRRWHELATSNRCWSHVYCQHYPHSTLSSDLLRTHGWSAAHPPAAPGAHSQSGPPAPAAFRTQHDRGGAHAAPITSPRGVSSHAPVRPYADPGPSRGRSSSQEQHQGRVEGMAVGLGALGLGPEQRSASPPPPAGLGPCSLHSPSGHSSWRAAYSWKLRLDTAWHGRQPWPLTALQEHSSWVNCVRLLPSCQRVVSGGADEQLCIWHTDGYLEHVCRTESGVYCMDACPHGQYTVTGGVAGEVHLWDLTTGTSRGQMISQGAAGSRASSVQCVDAHRVLVAHGNSPASLWDVRTASASPRASHGSPRGAHDRPGEEALQPIMKFPVTPAPGSMLPLRVRVTAARIDGNICLISDQDGGLHVCDVRMGGARITRVQAYDTEGREGDTPYIFSLAVSRGRAATGSLSGLIKVWDIQALTRAPLHYDYGRYALYDPHGDGDGPQGMGTSAALGAAVAGGGDGAGVGVGLAAVDGGGGDGDGAGIGLGAADADGVGAGGGGDVDGAGLRVVGPGEECALMGVGIGHTSGVFCLAWGEEWQLASASHDSSAAVWDTSGLEARRGQAPRALQHPMAWVPSLDQPLPLAPDQSLAAGGGGAEAGAIILRPNFPDGTTATGRRQMLARSRLPAEHRGCAVHAVDIASEPGAGGNVQVVVGGRDAMVRLYSVLPGGRLSRMGAEEDRGALWA